MIIHGTSWLRFVMRPFKERRKQKLDPETLERIALILEIREAQRNWQHAQLRLDYVEGKDQIDYAIFALEAAEKRYEMLLRRAKHMNLSMRNPNGELLEVES